MASSASVTAQTWPQASNGPRPGTTRGSAIIDPRPPFCRRGQAPEKPPGPSLPQETRHETGFSSWKTLLSFKQKKCQHNCQNGDNKEQRPLVPEVFVLLLPGSLRERMWTTNQDGLYAIQHAQPPEEGADHYGGVGIGQDAEQQSDSAQANERGQPVGQEPGRGDDAL